MTEITSEEDALVLAWRLLHTPELVKDHAGLEDYLLEEGIKTVELLGYCDPEDWQHIASFLRNKPRKRFVEIMHQWHLAKTGFAAHQLLATPLVLSTASSVAMPPPPPVVYGGGAHGGAFMAPPPPPPPAVAGDRGSGMIDDNEAEDDVQAYRIGLPAPSAATALPSSSASAALDDTTLANSTSPSKVIVDNGDVPELPNNPNVLCAMPEFCVIS
jgi:hypothetical protein